MSTNGISKVGPATIRGTATTEYRATIDLTKAAARKSPRVRAALESLDAQLHASSMPVQVWLDATGRVRQVSYAVAAATTPTTTTAA